MTSSRDAKRRMIELAPRDLISDLPANVIDGIVKQLPLHDAARLGVLSRKWRHAWMSLKHLKFDALFFKEVMKNKRSKIYEFYSIELYFRGWFFEFFARSCSLDIHERTFKHLKKLHISKICSASIFAFPFAIHLIQSCPEIEHLLLYFVITSSYVCKHEMGGDPCYRLRRL